MLDIEYISELVIAHLHGIQNKKESLDSYYKMYEQEFEDRRRVESLFNVVLGEIRVTLPELNATRWRKKSDFYSLFLVLAEQTSMGHFCPPRRYPANSTAERCLARMS